MRRLNCLFLGCFLFFGTLLSITPVVAQTNSIYEVQSLFPKPKDAIVRYWQGEKYVVYSIDGDSVAHFSLIEIPAMSFTDVSLNCVKVNDFEIQNDSVFLCGDSCGNPIFGFYDIPTFFSTGIGLHTVNLGGYKLSTEFSPDSERIESLNKLEVQICPDGIHVYMIGEATCSRFSTLNRCIVDLRGNISIGSMLVRFAQENGSIYYYDDIAVMDNEVVVIGHKNGSNGHYITFYNKPSSIATPLFWSYYLATYFYAGGFDDYWLDPHRPTMIEHLFGDYCAIVGYADVCIGTPYVNNRGTVISVYNSSNCVYRCVVPQGFADTAKWELKDFRYNKQTGRLYLLQEMSNPVSLSPNSVLCQFDVTTTGAITSASAYYEPGKTYLSLDQASNAWETVSVGKDKSMRLWHHDQSGPCVNNVILPLNVLQTLDNHLDYFHYPVEFDVDIYSKLGDLKKYNIKLICE